MNSTWLVAYDFSACADAAAREAARDLVRVGGRLVLLHVVALPLPPSSVPFAGLYPGYASYAHLQAEVGAGAMQHLREAAGKLVAEFSGLSVEVSLDEGSPAQRIVERARELGAERIVIGTHGWTGVDHLLLGSVAERVVRLSPVPVLVVKSPAPTTKS